MVWTTTGEPAFLSDFVNAPSSNLTSHSKRLLANHRSEGIGQGEIVKDSCTSSTGCSKGVNGMGRSIGLSEGELYLSPMCELAAMLKLCIGISGVFRFARGNFHCRHLPLNGFSAL
jgi:hypothetical protein